ncbi:BTAD domain-containing putative transcriptional regulator [Mycolicibacterium sediminis]|uniref:Transcriptional regulatory protein EmbR n=1 Tax=Mycolicibacterium sediminis TaxID=1286180 RepID=A0A7I7QYS2_9MYCO|nr:BTAD domain-containing putative transcriptional regulator [Mycolicibacterium sediminis]BBY31452.1 transcriptional regulatory protein EmbR [Mycolicibacterium sediminis]
MVLDFGVLGPLQITADGAPLPLGTPKQRAVLAVLVMNRNRPVAAESLVHAAWEQFPPPEPKASLHSYVSNLRRLLAGAGLDAKSALAGAPPGYRLAVPDASCDIGRFVAFKNAGVQAAAAGQFEQASRLLRDALSQWRGPVLEDLRDFDFVAPFAVALVEDKVVVHTARAEAEIACNRGHGVIGDLESLVAEHPYREPLWAKLIAAYYLAERQSDALDAHQRLKRTLADDLGIDPGPTIRALHQRILRQEPLNARKTAQTTAVHQVAGIDLRTSVEDQTAPASLRAVAGVNAGRVFPLTAAATRIGRLPDNDIVLDDANVSRHHAVVIDTGTSFVITDLRSANGVDVERQRIRGTATLDDGDLIRVCAHEFVLDVGRS